MECASGQDLKYFPILIALIGIQRRVILNVLCMETMTCLFFSSAILSVLFIWKEVPRYGSVVCSHRGPVVILADFHL